MNNINQVLHIDKETCDPEAEKLFIEIGGLGRPGEKFDRMRANAKEIRQKVDSRIVMDAVYSYFEDIQLQGNQLTVGGQCLTCNAFEQIEPSSVRGVYVYLLTAGKYDCEDEPILDQVFADMWGTAFTDAALALLEDYLGNDKRLSEVFGPGFFGMNLSQMQELAKLVDADSIGVEVREDSYLMPIKSCGGLYFVVTDKYTSVNTACADCLGNASGCQFCSINLQHKELLG